MYNKLLEILKINNINNLDKGVHFICLNIIIGTIGTPEKTIMMILIIIIDILDLRIFLQVQGAVKGGTIQAKQSPMCL